MASWSSRKAELMAKHSAINPVISVELSDTGSKNLLKAAPMSCAVSAVAMRAMTVFRGQQALDQQFIRFSEPLEQTFCDKMREETSLASRLLFRHALVRLLR